jgi:hypothetical protein
MKIKSDELRSKAENGGFLSKRQERTMYLYAKEGNILINIENNWLGRLFVSNKKRNE